jgi:transcriptional regulator with XRE-family HTH domain
MQLDIHLIRIDGGTQNRADGINEEVVQDYTEKLQAGVKFPPVEVYFDKQDYWLTDGFHRLTSHKRAGLTQIEVDVHEGSQRDAQWASYGVNNNHGYRKSIKDKRFVALKALEDLEWCDYSDRKIADHIGVSHSYISKLRKQSPDFRPTQKVVDRNGKKVNMETKNIGKKTEEEVEEYNPEDDRISEIIEYNQELIQENEQYKNKELVISGDEEKIFQKLEEANQQIKTLEAELKAVKLSRDQFQNKNAELIKQVAYWRKRCEKQN